MLNKSLILIASLALLLACINCSVTLEGHAHEDVVVADDASFSADDFAGGEVTTVQPVTVSVTGAYYLQAYDDNVAVYHVHLADHPDWDVVYHNNYYWMFREGQWFHTDSFDHPFKAIQASYIPTDVVTYHTHPLTGQVYQQFHGEPVNVHVGFAWNPSVKLEYNIKAEEYHNYYSNVKHEENYHFSAAPPGMHINVEAMHARAAEPRITVFHTPARENYIKAHPESVHARVDEHRAEGAAIHAEEHAAVRAEEHAAVRAEEHAAVRVEEHAAVRRRTRCCSCRRTCRCSCG